MEQALATASPATPWVGRPAHMTLVNEERLLVKRAQRGDIRAFEAIYRAHIDHLYGLCLRMTASRSEAEDCAQEAFIQAWSKINSFRSDSALGTWLHRIAVNVVLGRIRKAHREAERIQAVAVVSEDRPIEPDSSNLEDLAKAIDELPDGARHVFVLSAVYGYSHSETSEMLGIAEGTSKAQLFRARALLAEQLT